MSYEEASTPMGSSGPRSELTYFVGMDYKGRIGFRFTLVHNGILVIMQGYKGVSEQGL